MLSEIKNILKNDKLKIESVNFEIINKNRIKKLENLINEVI